MGAIRIWLVDGAAIVSQVPAVPVLVRALRAGHGGSLQGRSFHQRQGFEILRHSHGTVAQRDGTGRPIRPLVVAEPDDVLKARPTPTHLQLHEKSMAWGVKRFSNDDLRQRSST